MDTDKHKCFEIYLNKYVSICVLYRCPSVVFLSVFFAGVIIFHADLLESESSIGDHLRFSYPVLFPVFCRSNNALPLSRKTPAPIGAVDHSPGQRER